MTRQLDLLFQMMMMMMMEPTTTNDVVVEADDHVLSSTWLSHTSMQDEAITPELRLRYAIMQCWQIPQAMEILDRSIDQDSISRMWEAFQFWCECLVKEGVRGKEAQQDPFYNHLNSMRAFT